MSFSKPRFNKKYDCENIRTCSKIGHCVIGGFSKLLKYFKENYSGSIVSYIDRRYFNGKGYITDGFRYIGHTKPNYFYFINKENVLHNRVEFQKHRLTAPGRDRRKKDGPVSVPKERDAQTDAVASDIAVTLKYADAASGVAFVKIALVFQRGGHASAEDAVLYGPQKAVEIIS